MSTFWPRPELLGGLSCEAVCDELTVSRVSPGSLVGLFGLAAAACAPPPAVGGGVAVVLEEIDEAMIFGLSGRRNVFDYTPQCRTRQTGRPRA